MLENSRSSVLYELRMPRMHKEFQPFCRIAQYSARDRPPQHCLTVYADLRQHASGKTCGCFLRRGKCSPFFFLARSSLQAPGSRPCFFKHSNFQSFKLSNFQSLPLYVSNFQTFGILNLLSDAICSLFSLGAVVRIVVRMHMHLLRSSFG